MDIAVCPWGHFLASLGFDGRIYVYDYPQKQRIFEHQFPAHGTCMIWITPEVYKMTFNCWGLIFFLDCKEWRRTNYRFR